MPLDVQVQSVSDEDGVKVHDITYAGADGDRVMAFLVVPSGEGPFAGVVFLHRGDGSKYQFLDEAILLAKKGVISLLVQGSYNPESKNFIRTVINLRRGTDLLISRSDVDNNRLAYVGHSWAGTFGGILAGVDRRFKTYVLMAGVPSWSRQGEINKMIPLDAVRYVGQAAPATLFFQCAKQDEGISREKSLLYYETASEPKRIEWYDAGHRLNEEAQQDRLEWLSKELGLP
jgi:cephalosporin-C deacetylase-like acetyl esterase